MKSNNTSLLILCVAIATLAQIRADYTLNVLHEGVPRGRALRGETIELGVFLSASGNDAHDAAVFRLNFSSAGLVFNSYSWAAPYGTGTLEDASTPSPSLLPALLTPELASGSSFPFNVVDLEFSNITPQTGQVFQNGRLLTLSFSVPATYTGPDLITITPSAMEFVRGFTLINTLPGQTFELTVPEPTTRTPFAAAAILVSLAGTRRKISNIRFCEARFPQAQLNSE